MVPRASDRQPHLLHPSSAAQPKRSPSRGSASRISYQSCEADDERSLSDLSITYSAMGPISLDETAELPPPSYPGEDTRPTSRKELLGFYAYSWAAEVFVVCGLGAFIPITLEDLARASATAVLASDHSKPCKPQGLEVATREAGVPHHKGGEQCVFHILGTEINTASFAMYTFSVSVLIQALLVVTMSAAADHGAYRKRLLLMFAFVGAIASMLFLPVTPAWYFFGSLWAIVGNVCFGASFVLLNSFLPLMVRNHPKAREQRAGEGERLPTDFDEVSLSASFFLNSPQSWSWPVQCLRPDTASDACCHRSYIKLFSRSQRRLHLQTRHTCRALTDDTARPQIQSTYTTQTSTPTQT